MKKYGLAKIIHLSISITIFTALIVLRFFLEIEWNNNILLQIARQLIVLLLFFVGLWMLFTLSWIIFEPIYNHNERKKKQKQAEQGILLISEPIGELLFCNGWYKTEGISLFNEGYRISVRFESDSKDDHLSEEQKKAYIEFWSMYEHCCEEFEHLLEEKEYADIFEPSEIFFKKNGDYIMLASNTTSDDRYFEFVVTFNPLEATSQEIDYYK